MHVYQRNRKNSMQGHGTRVIVCLVRHSLRNIPAVSVNHISGMGRINAVAFLEIGNLLSAALLSPVPSAPQIG